MMVEYFRESPLPCASSGTIRKPRNEFIALIRYPSIPSITYKSFNPVSVFLKLHDRLISPPPPKWGRLESMIRIHT